jgi:hypothetical protein
MTAGEYVDLPVFAPHLGGNDFEALLHRIKTHSADPGLFCEIMKDLVKLLSSFSDPQFELQFRAGSWINSERQTFPGCVMQFVVKSEVQAGMMFCLDASQRVILSYIPLTVVELAQHTLPSRNNLN